MNKLKNIAKSTIVILTILFGNSLLGQNLKLKIYNKTGFDLDSVVVGEKYIGVIKKAASVEILDCKEISMQGNIIFGFPAGFVKNKKKNPEQLLLCGTGVTSVSKGKFKFDLIMEENEFGYRLYWSQHK